MKKTHYITAISLSILLGGSYLLWAPACKKQSEPESAMEQLEKDAEAAAEKTKDAAENAIETMKEATK